MTSRTGPGPEVAPPEPVRPGAVGDALARFLGWILLVALEIGLILFAVGPLYEAGYETTTNVLLAVATLALLATAPSALAAKLVFAKTLGYWLLGLAFDPE